MLKDKLGAHNSPPQIQYVIHQKLGNDTRALLFPAAVVVDESRGIVHVLGHGVLDYFYFFRFEGFAEGLDENLSAEAVDSEAGSAFGGAVKEAPCVRIFRLQGFF